jgi:hypothetical protein
MFVRRYQRRRRVRIGQRRHTESILERALALCPVLVRRWTARFRKIAVCRRIALERIYRRQNGFSKMKGNVLFFRSVRRPSETSSTSCTYQGWGGDLRGRGAHPRVGCECACIERTSEHNGRVVRKCGYHKKTKDCSVRLQLSTVSSVVSSSPASIAL